MPNLRIIGDNAAKRATSIVASTQAGSLTADRLKLGVKSKVWRSTAVTATTLTVTLPTPETMDCVALAFTNMTATGTVRVQGYATTGAGTAAVDVTKNPFVPPATNMVPGVNSFSNGGASQAVCWFTSMSLQKIVITLTDSGNSAGYIEASCLVMGASWSPRINAGYGAGVGIKESTKNERTESGNLRSDRGTMARSVNFDMKNLSATERAKVWGILLANGLFSPVFISLYPASTDATEEQMHQLYGKLTQQSRLSLQSFGISQATLEIEEI